MPCAAHRSPFPADSSPLMTGWSSCSLCSNVKRRNIASLAPQKKLPLPSSLRCLRQSPTTNRRSTMRSCRNRPTSFRCPRKSACCRTVTSPHPAQRPPAQPTPAKPAVPEQRSRRCRRNAAGKCRSGPFLNRTHARRRKTAAFAKAGWSYPGTTHAACSRSISTGQDAAGPSPFLNRVRGRNRKPPPPKAVEPPLDAEPPVPPDPRSAMRPDPSARCRRTNSRAASG